MHTYESCAHKLKSLFDPYITIEMENWIRFTKEGTIVKAKKNTVLKEPNTTEQYLRFILAGSGGILAWSNNNYVCFGLTYENNFLCDYLSFRQQRPSETEIRLFEDSELLRISAERFVPMVSSARGEELLRIIAEANLQAQHERQKELLTKTARERYEALVEKQPDIPDRTPQKYLASYLGITPQSLSRLHKS